jgi:glycosyltransferase involved in cell wall biosynthesis
MSIRTQLNVLALEPYAAPSHMAFLRGLKAHSRHEWSIISLPPRKWKWRLRTSAIHFARALNDLPRPDLLFVSDYLNLAEMNALLAPSRQGIPTLLYFHENQLTYPLQDHERRDFHFGLTHLYSILAADRTLFNSHYHRDQFLDALEVLLKLVPDITTGPAMETCRSRSSVLPLGVGMPAQPKTFLPTTRPPRILWNHRWEYDKRPEAFLEGLQYLVDHHCDFQVLILGQRFQHEHPVLQSMRELLGPRLEDAGYQKERSHYHALLADSDIVVSTAIHEYFGLGALEALRAGAFPVLPNDLAYPELLPEELQGAGTPFLYDPSAGLGPPLLHALDVVRKGGMQEERQRLKKSTDRFAWRNLIPIYDRFIDELASAPGLKKT